MKITKREYTKQMNDLTSRKTITANYVQKLIDNIDNLNRPLTEDEGTKLNRLHDKVADLSQQIKDLEDRWNRRNWTGSDYNTYALIAQNID